MENSDYSTEVIYETYNKIVEYYYSYEKLKVISFNLNRIHPLNFE